MNIKLFFTPAGVADEEISGKTTVLIDVLRATSVIAVALNNGAREVVPVAALGDATSMKQKLDKSTVLMGAERQGEKVEGFDLGNSPFEYGSSVVGGKSIILATSNGSGGIIRASEGNQCLTCSFINISSVAEKILQSENDISIICAGNNGGFSLEDALCGGMLVKKLSQDNNQVNLVNDASWVALRLYDFHQDNLSEALKESDHGSFLSSLGFEQDVEFCAKVDQLHICPIWESGRLIIENNN